MTWHLSTGKTPAETPNRLFKIRIWAYRYIKASSKTYKVVDDKDAAAKERSKYLADKKIMQDLIRL